MFLALASGCYKVNPQDITIISNQKQHSTKHPTVVLIQVYEGFTPCVYSVA